MEEWTNNLDFSDSIRFLTICAASTWAPRWLPRVAVVLNNKREQYALRKERATLGHTA
jgi:hypothetical protein